VLGPGRGLGSHRIDGRRRTLDDRLFSPRGRRAERERRQE
jgi:hypothetical protein